MLGKRTGRREDSNLQVRLDQAELDLHRTPVQLDNQPEILWESPPERVEIRQRGQHYLVWDSMPTLGLHSLAGCLPDFIDLYDKPDEQVLRFVRRWGVLHAQSSILEDEFSCSIGKYEPTGTYWPIFWLHPREFSDYYHRSVRELGPECFFKLGLVYKEPVAVYRYLSQQFRTILGITADLLAEQPINDVDWERLCTYEPDLKTLTEEDLKCNPLEEYAAVYIARLMERLFHTARVIPALTRNSDSGSPVKTNHFRMRLSVRRDSRFRRIIYCGKTDDLIRPHFREELQLPKVPPDPGSTFGALVVQLAGVLTSAGSVFRCGICDHPMLVGKRRPRAGTLPLCANQECHREANRRAKARQRLKVAG